MTLTTFVKLFPQLDPPITLTEESVFAFSKQNKPVGLDVAMQYFNTFEEEKEVEDDVEFIPCFRLKLSEAFHSIVYWRGAAMQYEYYLVNIDKKGKVLDRRLIGGIMARDGALVRLAVSIDINYIFYIAAQLVEEKIEDENSIQTYSLEVLPDGNIVSS